MDLNLKKLIEEALGKKYEDELAKRSDESNLEISVKEFTARDKTQDAVVVRITYADQPCVECTLHVLDKGEKRQVFFINNKNHHVIFNNYGIDPLAKAMPYVDRYFWKSFQRMIANKNGEPVNFSAGE